MCSQIPWKMVVPPESTTLACKFLRMSTLNCLEQHFRVTATFGANRDDVSVWELKSRVLSDT